MQVPGWALVAGLLWAALHDRPLGWACDRRHWAGTSLRPARLPSLSTLSRRPHTVGVGLLLRALEGRLRDRGDPGPVAFLDGKPLTVSGVSKDHDATYGRAAGCKAKGYKLHAAWSGRCLPEAWEVTTLTAAEPKVGKGLIDRLGHGGYPLADGNYDDSRLFDVAAGQGYQVVVPLPAGENPGSGNHYQSPHRRRSIELMRPPQRVPGGSGRRCTPPRPCRANRAGARPGPAKPLHSVPGFCPAASRTAAHYWGGGRAVHRLTSRMAAEVAPRIW